MRIIMVIMLLVLLTILVSAHFFVFSTIAKFFHITNVKLKSIFIVLSLALPILFIITSIITRVFDSKFNELIYAVVATWFGVLANLLFACLIGYVFFYLFNYFKINNFNYLFSLLVIAALVVSIYGIWNAFNPQLKNITVHIKNLPANWQNKKIVYISDLHLGAVNQLGFMKKVNALINAQDADLVLIGGDYFDGTCERLTDLASPLTEMKSKNGIYFINGNHESYIDGNVDQILANVGVHVLKNEITEINGLNIIGADFTTDFGNKATVEELLKKVNPDGANIFLYHEPRYVNQAKAAGIKLQLAGHTHDGQQLPFNFFTWLIYGKYDSGFYTEGDYNIYTSTGVGTWGPPMRIGNTPEVVAITLNKTLN
jgi:uncharacterized protein